jgi:hypothetical protein
VFELETSISTALLIGVIGFPLLYFGAQKVFLHLFLSFFVLVWCAFIVLVHSGAYFAISVPNVLFWCLKSYAKSRYIEKRNKSGLLSLVSCLSQ